MTKTVNDNVLVSLKNGLRDIKGQITLADASLKSGLSLLDAKGGLNHLLMEYRGSLSATSEGELLYGFPTGFNKPWETEEALERLWAKTKKFSLGILKFLVRSWITIVMVGYVVIFALIFALLFLVG